MVLSALITTVLIPVILFAFFVWGCIWCIDHLLPGGIIQTVAKVILFLVVILALIAKLGPMVGIS